MEHQSEAAALDRDLPARTHQSADPGPGRTNKVQASFSRVRTARPRDQRIWRSSLTRLCQPISGRRSSVMPMLTRGSPMTSLSGHPEGSRRYRSWPATACNWCPITRSPCGTSIKIDPIYLGRRRRRHLFRRIPSPTQRRYRETAVASGASMPVSTRISTRTGRRSLRSRISSTRIIGLPPTATTTFRRDRGAPRG